jgi:hypothetical protein
LSAIGWHKIGWNVADDSVLVNKNLVLNAIEELITLKSDIRLKDDFILHKNS